MAAGGTRASARCPAGGRKKTLETGVVLPVGSCRVRRPGLLLRGSLAVAGLAGDGFAVGIAQLRSTRRRRFSKACRWTPVPRRALVADALRGCRLAQLAPVDPQQSAARP